MLPPPLSPFHAILHYLLTACAFAWSAAAGIASLGQGSTARKQLARSRKGIRAQVEDGAMKRLQPVAGLFFAALFATPLAAQPFDDFLLLIDTSGSMNEGTKWPRLKAALDDFADSIDADGSVRVWLLPYSGSLAAPQEFVLGDAPAKQNFKVKLQSVKSTSGGTQTWGAFNRTLDLVVREQAAGKSRRASIHLFTDGEAGDARLFGPSVVRFRELRRQQPDLRFFYHGLEYDPPGDVRAAAATGSGITVIPGLAMPPHLLPEKIFPPGTIHKSGVPRAWPGEAVGVVERWSWDFGDGQTSSEPNPTHTFAKSGGFRVRVVAENKAGSDQREFAVTVGSGPPRADFRVEGRYTGTAIVFTDDSEGEITSREWVIDGAVVGRATTLERVFDHAGDVSVTLAVTGPGGKHTATRSVPIGDRPTAEFSWMPARPTRGEPIAFLNRSTNLSGPWMWDFDDGATATDQHPEHTYREHRTFRVKLTGRAPDGTTLHQTREVVVATDAVPPVAGIAEPAGAAANRSIFVAERITLQEQCTGTITRYAWDMGDGRRLEGRTVSHAYTAPGPRVVTLTVTGPLGSASATLALTVAEPDLRIVPGSTPVWIGAETLFTLENAPAHLKRARWIFGDEKAVDSEVGQPSIRHSYAAPGPHTIKVQATFKDGDGPDVEREFTATVDVHVDTPVLRFDVTSDRAKRFADEKPRRLSGPAAQTITITNECTGPIRSLTWDFGDGTTSDERGATLTHTYTKRGRYVVTVTAIDRRDGKHDLPQDERFVVEVTGWRPAKVWRWPVLVGLVLGLGAFWRLSPFQYRRVRYQCGNVGTSAKSWRRDPVLRKNGVEIPLKLVRTVWLRKRYRLRDRMRVDWRDLHGTRPNRPHLAPRDTLTKETVTFTIQSLNDSRNTAVTTWLWIAAIVTMVAWLTWSLFV